MKRIIGALMTAVILLTALSACNSRSYALMIGDVKITPAQYRTTAISLKNQFITSNDMEENDELWDRYIDTSYTSTVQQYLDAMVQSYIITYNLYSINFDELGLKLDEETEATIKDTLAAFEQQYGSRETLDASLKEQGYSYDEFAAQYYNEAKKKAVILYYFGPDSTEQPITVEDLSAYYNEYYTKVKHIFLSTKDSSGNDMSIPDKEKVGVKAQNILKQVQNGVDFESLINEYNEDPGMATNPDGYIFSTDDTSYTKIFHNTAFELKPNEIKLIQSNLGYHIMKRYPFDDSELSDKNTQATLIENMMSEEANAVLDTLKERIGVKYNNTVLAELSVKNLPKTDTNAQNDPQSVADQLKDSLTSDEE